MLPTLLLLSLDIEVTTEAVFWEGINSVLMLIGVLDACTVYNFQALKTNVQMSMITSGPKILRKSLLPFQ